MARGTQSVAVRGWWVLGTLLVPFGLGSGVAFWYAARRASGVRALARRIVRARREIRGFSWLEDMGTVLDLPPDLVEDVRERAIFLPQLSPLAAKV